MFSEKKHKECDLVFKAYKHTWILDAFCVRQDGWIKKLYVLFRENKCIRQEGGAVRKTFINIFK